MICANDKPKNFIIIGGPNSGKGSQSQLLAKRYNLKHISMGDLLREAISQKTELGLVAKTYIDKGQLVPDELPLELLKREINNSNGQGLLLDGYPRTTNQAVMLEDVLKIDIVIMLDVPDEILAKRATSRRICNKCKYVFRPDELLVSEPKCSCGGSPIQRDDDKPETVKERLKTFRNISEKVINFYKLLETKGKVRVIIIDGRPEIATVDKMLVKEIEKIND